MVVRFDLSHSARSSPGLKRPKIPSPKATSRRSSRHAPRTPPSRYKRMYDPTRPLCPGCGERDRVIMPGEAFFGGGACEEPFCERCLGYLATLQPRHGRHVPDF
jgi:hypothetical protein